MCALCSWEPQEQDGELGRGLRQREHASEVNRGGGYGLGGNYGYDMENQGEGVEGEAFAHEDLVMEGSGLGEACRSRN